jgi:hypothetical protein
MLPDYHLKENHVSKRSGLPADIRQTLLESTRSEWQNHPRYGGKAGFFMMIHRDLIDGAAKLNNTLERLLDIPKSDAGAAFNQMNVLPFSRRLIGFAHHHHEIEDHAYFPQFVHLHPEMNRGLALLDGDHKVLDAALADTQKALDNLASSEITRDQLSALYAGAQSLQAILERHIWDEEEIIIPILLRHG